MALPDKTLCWVEGPQWDRFCAPIKCSECGSDIDAEGGVGKPGWLCGDCAAQDISADSFAPYPRQDGENTVIGPECFASKDESIITWRGENYIRASIDPSRSGHRPVVIGRLAQNPVQDPEDDDFSEAAT